MHDKCYRQFYLKYQGVLCFNLLQHSLVSNVIELVNENSLNYDQECKPEIKVVLEQTLLPGKATQSSNTLAAPAVNQYVFIIYSQGGLRAIPEQIEL